MVGLTNDGCDCMMQGSHNAFIESNSVDFSSGADSGGKHEDHDQPYKKKRQETFLTFASQVSDCQGALCINLTDLK